MLCVPRAPSATVASPLALRVNVDVRSSCTITSRANVTTVAERDRSGASGGPCQHPPVAGTDCHPSSGMTRLAPFPARRRRWSELFDMRVTDRGDDATVGSRDHAEPRDMAGPRHPFHTTTSTSSGD